MDCNALLELHWTICPYCGNEHADPYHVGPPIMLPNERQPERLGQGEYEDTGSAEVYTDETARDELDDLQDDILGDAPGDDFDLEDE